MEREKVPSGIPFHGSDKDQVHGKRTSQDVPFLLVSVCHAESNWWFGVWGHVQIPTDLQTAFEHLRDEKVAEFGVVMWPNMEARTASGSTTSPQFSMKRFEGRLVMTLPVGI